MDDTPSSSSPRLRNLSVWPNELVEVFERSITVEYASLTRDGRPVTVPTTPYIGADGLTIDVSTGLTYPAKAERARRDPRVCLLFADPVGSGLTDPPVVLVQGLATVRDADLQANTDRYVRVSMEKLPDATKGQPRFVLRRLAWYYARIWIEVTPLHMRWWSGRRSRRSTAAVVERAPREPRRRSRIPPRVDHNLRHGSPLPRPGAPPRRRPTGCRRTTSPPSTSTASPSVSPSTAPSSSTTASA